MIARQEPRTSKTKVRATRYPLRVSPGTVMSDWKLAKVWLLHELREQKRYGP